jgi:hypothetical protein
MTQVAFSPLCQKATRRCCRQLVNGLFSTTRSSWRTVGPRTQPALLDTPASNAVPGRCDAGLVPGSGVTRRSKLPASRLLRRSSERAACGLPSMIVGLPDDRRDDEPVYATISARLAHHLLSRRSRRKPSGVTHKCTGPNIASQERFVRQ